MSGLDVAAGIAGLISLSITAFHGCVKGFVLLSTAQHLGRDVDAARCMLEWEQYRLFQWSEIVHLESNSPNRNLDWELATRLLEQLGSLLTSADQVKADYDLYLEATEDEICEAEITGSRRGVGKLMTRLRPEFYNVTARIVQKRTSPWKKLRWAAMDKEGIRLLVQDISYFNNCLYELFKVADQEFCRGALSTLLRDLVSRSSESSELEVVKQLLHPDQKQHASSLDSAIAAAATLKQKRLALGLDEHSVYTRSVGSVNSSPMGPPLEKDSQQRSSKVRAGRGRTLKLRPDRLMRQPSALSPNSNRELAIYDGRPVLLEWKTVDIALESKLKYRIESLATLLSDIDDPSFHSLRCLGFLKEHDSGQYAYVFNLPILGIRDEIMQRSHAFKTLLELLGPRNRKPSLNERFSLSIALTETVLQLHTSGWLHKGIRSENVLFFEEKESYWGCANIGNPIVLGYEYSRADNPLEATEAPRSQQGVDLYRHPSSVGAHRVFYRKRFDLYALGCVLLEVGLWSSLQTILLHTMRARTQISKSNLGYSLEEELQYTNQAEFVSVNMMKQSLLKEEGNSSVKAKLEFATGKTFADVVAMCLTAGEEAEGDDEEMEVLLDVQETILEKLRGCRC
ncbi:MAG: hypothetical protein M1827_003939 [Pycnora praestabilis]|nr:MAG: hypothetical protein M1827_003939 [Pycnora praestabilis]